MKERNRLHVGDVVLWKGLPPDKPMQLAQVKEIQKNLDGITLEGKQVVELPWKRVKRESVIVYLDTTHWDYGYNIRRLKRPKGW